MTFDKKRFNFMGTCEYVFAEDCSGGSSKEFSVLVKNVKCGRRGASCTKAVTILLAGDKIELMRNPRFVVINNAKNTEFPITAEGYEIRKPSSREIYLTSTKVGLSVTWNCLSTLEVTLSGQKRKTCGLCGNNNGDPSDDKIPKFSKQCEPTSPPPCFPNPATKAEIDKCKLMKASPFQACNAVVDPNTFVRDCEYDVCRCENPTQCMCSSFADYSSQCARNGKAINWRFKGTYLHPRLTACAQQCKNSGEIFQECGLACERTCRDLSSDAKCSEECIPGCQCPPGQLLNDAKQCVPIAQCPCQYNGKTIQAGTKVQVGNCKTCTCNSGVMECVDDRNCTERGPCEWFPCKNNGNCTKKGDSFSCECVGDFQGETCEDPKPKPCDSFPCQNDGICTNTGATFFCQCRNNFIGRTCEDEPPDPCKPNPCKNNGTCQVIGNGFSCKCKPLFGGEECQDEQAFCRAAGDPHYRTFDGKKFDFQGKCEYILAEDCKNPVKLFRVWTKNVACGPAARGVSCVSVVRILIEGFEIKLTRNLRTVIVNGTKNTQFPVKRPGFVIINPTERWLHVITDIGVTVKWDCRNSVTVIVPKSQQTCGLCGNNNGSPGDDTINPKDFPCVPPEESCIAGKAVTGSIIAKCDLMRKPPFSKCNQVVDPTSFIKDCKYDACRCDGPMQCVCNSFAAYSQSCSEQAVVLDWRFSWTFLVPGLSPCGQKCNISQQIFTECGSSCVQSCSDLSRATECQEQCVPGCHCPSGLVLSYENKCIPVSKCPCKFEGKTYEPGISVDVGNCTTCTCSKGAMKCVEDRKCSSPGPCDYLPCINDGICSVVGNSFACKCSADYQGKTCEELKPKPCDSQPCLNNGVCTNAGNSSSCECAKGFTGKTCADALCKGTKLDILYVVDGSGSVRSDNFKIVKEELKQLSKKFEIGPQKTQIALIQFGKSTQTRVEFNLGARSSLAAVLRGVDKMKNFSSLRTDTGDALKKAREQVFNGAGGDRNTAANVLILFTDGIASDSGQLDEAKKLKDAGVKIITVAMGSEKTVSQFRSTLKQLASVSSETGQPLTLEAGFANLKDITSGLVKEAC